MSCDINPTVINETWCIASKNHTCCECRNTIKCGERYQYIKGLWDGTWAAYKTCEPCADLRYSLEKVWRVPLGELRREYMDYLDSLVDVEIDGEGRIIRTVNHITMTVWPPVNTGIR